MVFLDVLLIGVGLAMNAFAVSVCKGMTMPRQAVRKALIVAGYFAVFQALMPLLGFILGSGFSPLVSSLNRWIAFILLALIGVLMIRESFHPEEAGANDDVSFKVMLPLAVATSIDALATGVSFAFMNANVWYAVSIIGLVTFLLCFAGVLLGRVAGEKLQKRARLLGGIVLILIGLKILLE